MSTKTTIKRIALVAVSALGMGLLSVVPANAANSAVTSVAVTSATATVDVGSAATTTFSVVNTAIVEQATSDTVKIAISLSKPTSSTASITDENGANSGATNTLYSSTDIASYDSGSQAAGVITLTNSAGADIAAAASLIGGTLKVTPDVPGTYIVTIQGKNAANNATSGAAVTFTVTANPTNNTNNAIRNSISLAKVTSAPSINNSVAVNFLANVDTVTDQTYDQSFSFKGYLSSYPAGGFTQVSVSTSAPTTDTEIWVAAGTGTTESVTESNSGATYTVTLDGDSADEDYTGNTAVATALVGAAQFSFTPTVAGTYVISVWADDNADGAVSISEAVQTVSITVAGQAGFSQTLSTSFIDDNSSYDATTDEEVRVSKTAGTAGASIMVDLKDVNGAAFYGARVQADVSGPGYVDAVTGGTAYGAATARTDYVDLASNVSTARVHVTADGTAGTATITITIKDATTLATLGSFKETMYFYGTVASLTATKNFNVARANATERGCSNATTCTGLAFATTPFVQIVAKDAEGNLVPGAALANAVTAKITDTAIIAASTVTAVTAEASATTAGVSTDPYGLGYFNASVAGNVAATSGQKTTIVYRTLLADGVTYVTSNAVEISIGGSAYNQTVALDKSSYDPGEGMTVTLTCKDSAGNACYDGLASPAVSFSKAVSGELAADIYLDGAVTSDNSRGAKTIFAPVSGGNFTATIAGKVAGTTSDITATAAVVSTESQAAADAANEATEAANAATDAANAAAEAADAATAAAQDAQAAVADLAAQVASMVASVRTQLTRLSNLIIKIQKKVNA
jgi:hypothetical protein